MSTPGRPAPRTPPYVALCLELMAGVGRTSARAMFGGHGLYVDGLMVGLVAAEELYLKVDGHSLESWRAAGGRPFCYERGGGKPPIQMSYWTPPAEAFDGEHAMQPWAQRALAAALRARTAKAAPRRRP